MHQASTDQLGSGQSEIDQDSFPYDVWIHLFSRCTLLKTDVYVRQGKYLHARQLFLHLMEVLQAPQKGGRETYLSSGKSNRKTLKP